MSLQVRVCLSKLMSSTPSSDTQLSSASPKKTLSGSLYQITDTSNESSLGIKEVSLKHNRVSGNFFRMFSSCTYLKNYEKLYTTDVLDLPCLLVVAKDIVSDIQYVVYVHSRSFQQNLEVTDLVQSTENTCQII